MKISNWLPGILLLAAGIIQPSVGLAVIIGQIDTFEDGTTQNWVVDLNGRGINPNPPVNVATGGPKGAGDHYLLCTANGNFGAGSKLSVINVTQWKGNFLAAKVNAIGMFLNNQGSTNLSLRIYLADPVGINPPTNQAISTVPVVLSAGSGWISAVFPIAPGHLTAVSGNVIAALQNCTELRIFHNPNASYPPPVVLANLGVDEITAKTVGVNPGAMNMLLLSD